MHNRDQIQAGLERTRWSRAITLQPVPSKTRQHEQIQSEVDAWLAAGNEIECVPGFQFNEVKLLE